MQDVKVYLKSGQVVEFVTENLTKYSNSLTPLSKLEWQNIIGEKILFYLDIDQIDAITIEERQHER